MLPRWQFFQSGQTEQRQIDALSRIPPLYNRLANSTCECVMPPSNLSCAYPPTLGFAEDDGSALYDLFEYF
jgi:hypothetical protein